MLLLASVASCWVVGSSTAAAVPPSLSARRDSERASRRSAVIAFAEGGSGLSMSVSATHRFCSAQRPTHDSHATTPVPQAGPLAQITVTDIENTQDSVTGDKR
jgi:hypothetical protein